MFKAIIIIIFYFENVAFFHAKLGSNVCPSPQGRQVRQPNLWRHFTRFNSTTKYTKYNSIISTFLQINASFVQGSRIGPIAYVYNASDLHALFPENDLNKYADDTYLIVPSSNSHTVSLELDHISEWVQCNNLMLNTAKSMKMIIHKPGVKLGNMSVPQPTAGVTRCSSFENFGRYCHRHPIFRPSHFECCHTVCPNRLCPSHTKVSWAQWSCSLECHSRHPNI